ncbi:MAG TPA: hypothetical protein VJ184_13140 [Chryseolinea sp.]|nr:hypothetical protein [Chryseolinea sp.]
MKFVLQLMGIALLAYIFELFLPWYYIAVAAFLMGYLLKSRANFFAGFLGIAFIWLLKAWLMDSAGDTDLAERVAHIFSLKQKELLFLIMAIVGGLVGGFGALSGALLKSRSAR